MKSLDVTAPDISCQHCKTAIEHDLAEAPGVHQVAVDIDAKAVRVDYDDAETDDQALRAVLTEIGYPPA